MKKGLIILIIVGVIGGLYIVNKRSVEVKSPSGDQNGEVSSFRPNPSNATFLFDDGPITLSRGRNERTTAPGTGLVEETVLTEHIAYGDLNDDSRDDAVVLLTRSGGGSGFFIYVAGFVSGTSAYKGTNAVYVGDRVNPRSISISNGVVVLEYLDRDPNEPFAAEPTVPSTMRLMMRSGELVEL